MSSLIYSLRLDRAPYMRTEKRNYVYHNLSWNLFFFVAAASMHNRGGIVSGNNNVTFSSVPAVLHKSESIPNCCSAAAGYPSSANMAPLTLQRAVSASVIVSSAAASVMGESVLKQQRLLAHDAFDDEEVVEDESDEISGEITKNFCWLNSVLLLHVVSRNHILINIF